MPPPMFYQRLFFVPMWYWFHEPGCGIGIYMARRARRYAERSDLP